MWQTQTQTDTAFYSLGYIAFLAWWGPCVNFIDVSLMRAGWLWQLSRVTTSSHVTCPLTIITPCLIALLKSIRMRSICPSHKYHALCTGMNKIKNLLGPIVRYQVSSVLQCYFPFLPFLLQCDGFTVPYCCSVLVLQCYDAAVLQCYILICVSESMSYGQTDGQSCC